MLYPGLPGDRKKDRRDCPWTTHLLAGVALLALLAMAACGGGGGGSGQTPTVGDAEEDTGTAPAALEATIELTPADGVIAPGDSVTFTGSANGGAEPYRFDWVFDGEGGGGVSPVEAPDVNPAGPVTFSNRGTFTVTLTVTDAAAATATATATVSLPAPPGGVPGALLWASGPGDVTNVWDQRNWH